MVWMLMMAQGNGKHSLWRLLFTDVEFQWPVSSHTVRSQNPNTQVQCLLLVSASYTQQMESQQW